ncbi:MAG: 2-dehydropantoate 2-reductase [Rhodospirillales bacterium]|nr:2-dehydropantoate 2-reductase [Rhodospirillales bacterium]MDE0380203.1 2-dehydropantoate 2-reductase [Rhodospirillales bacterium]MDE0392918.1 2-dehydropantoate 2-reductase [Rhodospirillales bacterium]
MSAPLLVWGAGAIGGTIGAYLVRAGHAVTFVDIVEDHVAAIAATGLAIEGPVDAFRVASPAETPDTLSGRYDRVLLCIKGQHTEAAVRSLAPFLADEGYAVSVQNGLNEPAMAALLGRERVIGCFVNFGADYLEPGRIHFGGRGAVVLGELDGEITPRLRALLDVFRDFEPDAKASANIWGYLWGKLGYGALLFATALGNESIADALAQPAHRALYRVLGEEVMRVADAGGIAPEGFNGFDPAGFVPGADPALAERSMAAMVAHNRGSAKSHSGVWRDLAVRKRPTEVEPMIGAVVREAQARGIETPLLARLVAMIHEVEEGRRPLDRANIDELAAQVA